ncbi:nucleic-acid-binding protein from transposon X-element [Trichonephila clavipes]|nr:nucleic-acid-binding protein from transposon X-element [Trichonephila clavipes]
METTEQDNTDYTSAYLEFHKECEIKLSTVLDHLSESRTSTDCSAVIREIEELDSKLREYPFSKQEEQSAALRSLSDLLDEARYKFTHQKKQELAEQNQLLQAQIDAWGLPTKPINFPFQVVLRKKGRKASGPEEETSAKKQRTDVTTTQNQFAQLTVEDMDLNAQGTSTSADNGAPSAAAPPKKHHVPPITIDNVSNQAGLLKHLQGLTNLKLEAKLLGTKLRIYPQTAYAYHLIRKYVEENQLESFTYILPEDKKLRLVIRGLPTDMSPVEIIGSLAEQNISVNECHIMTSKKTGKEMPLFLITMDKTEQNRAAYHVTNIGYMKVKVEALRPKYGPPQCFRCQGFFHSSRFCTRAPRCVKCAGAHLAKECTKPIDQKPKCCLCEGEHPASFLGCPRNPRNKINPESGKTKETSQNAAKPTKTVIETPPPPKVNFWEQRAKNAAARQQPNPSTSKKIPQASTSTAHTSVDTAEDIFEQLNSPAVQETFDLLEEFITIAHTIPTNNRSNLTVISWNANGIRSRIEEFRSFIADWNPDIINLQETHLQPCHNFTFPDYSIYRTDRTFRGGGTAIMVKRSIPHHQIVINNNSLETTAIKLTRQDDDPITIISAYRPPRKPLPEQDLHRIFRSQGYVLVAGDLNAKHVSWSPLTQQNVPGTTIRRFCDNSGYAVVAPTEPTRFHRNCRNTTIDIAICKGMTVTECTSILELSSDHNPVLFEVSLDNFTSPALSTYSFQTDLNSRISSLLPFQEIPEFPTPRISKMLLKTLTILIIVPSPIVQPLNA